MSAASASETKAVKVEPDDRGPPHSPPSSASAMQDDDDDDEDEAEQGEYEEELSDDDESDDEVVSEYPVFLHQELTPNLYLVCSPLRPFSRPYSADVGPLQSVRVKPQQKRLEVEYQLTRDDPSSSSSPSSSPFNPPPASSSSSSFNFDPSAAHPLTNLVLAGRPVPSKTNYCIGRFDGRALHLTPLHASVRLKPDLSYLDVQAEEEAKEAETARREEEREKERDIAEWSLEDERKEAEEEEETLAGGAKLKDMRQLTVRFKKKESDRSAAFRTASHAYIKQMEEKELWLELQPHHADSPLAQRELEQLTAPLPSHPPPSKAETLTATAYLAYFDPHSSRSQLSSAPLADRVLALLRSARSLPFHLLLNKLGVSLTSPHPHVAALREEALHYCDRFAYYIQHAFVVKSILVFDPHLSATSLLDHTASASGWGGVKNERDREREREREREMRERERRSPGREEMCRDYLLCQFYASPVVYRDRVGGVMRLDLEATETRLGEVSEKREGASRGGWQWKWREDERETRLVQALPAFAQLQKLQEKMIKEMETRAKWALEPQQTTAATASPPATSPSSSLIINHNQPAPLISTSLSSSPSTPSSSAASSGSAQTAAFSLLTSLFREHGVCSESYLMAQFHQAASSPTLPPSPLASLAPDTFRALIATFSLPITSSLFIRKSLSNPAVDRYRSVIASLFAVRSRVKKGDVHRAIEDCYGDEIPDNLYRKVMKEFATFDKGIWQLKTGDY